MESSRSNKFVQKKESILRPDIRVELNDLLNKDYKLARPTRILLNIDRNDLESTGADKVGEYNAYRTRVHSEGPPVGHIRNVVPISLGSDKLLVESGTQTDLSKLTTESITKTINTTVAEVELLSYNVISEKDRLEQLKALLTDDSHHHHYYYKPKQPHDPCIEWKSYFRGAGRGDRNSMSRRSRSAPKLLVNDILTHCRSTQTVLEVIETSSVAPPTPKPRSDKNKSTQTILDSSPSPSDSNADSPTHEVAKAKTIAVIKTDKTEETNIINEQFFFKNKKNYDLDYLQFSEYRTDLVNNKVEKINSYLDISDKSNKPKSKLSHSAIEMTSVVKNKTTVTGIPIKDAIPELFTVQVLNPNSCSYEPMAAKPAAEACKLSPTPPAQPRVQQPASPKTQSPSVQQRPSFSPRLTPTLTTQTMNIVSSLGEEKYDLTGQKNKQKPFILKCDDVELLNSYDVNKPKHPNAALFNSNQYAPNPIRVNSPASQQPKQQQQYVPNQNLKNIIHESRSMSPKTAKLNLRDPQITDINFDMYENSNRPGQRTALKPLETIMNRQQTITSTPPAQQQQASFRSKSSGPVKSSLSSTYNNPYYNPHKYNTVRFAEEKNSNLTQNYTIRQLGPTSAMSMEAPAAPEIKERKTSTRRDQLNISGPNNYVDIDFSAYEKQAANLNINTKPIINNNNNNNNNNNKNNNNYMNNFKPAPQGSAVKIQEQDKALNLLSLDRVDNRRGRANESDTDKLVENFRQKFRVQTVATTHEDEESQSQSQQPSEAHVTRLISNEPEHRIVDQLPPESNLTKWKYISKSEDNINAQYKRRFRVTSRYPTRVKHALNSGQKPRLVRSFENIYINESENESGSSDVEVFNVSGISPTGKKPRPPIVRQTQPNFNLQNQRMRSTKLDALIDAKLKVEYHKALKRIGKRKQRVPEILRQLDKVNSKERKRLESELNLLMRKAKFDTELVNQFDSKYATSETEELESDDDEAETDGSKTTLTTTTTAKRTKPNPKRKANVIPSDDQLETTDFESSSINSFQFVKNKPINKNVQKYTKKPANKPFESGYSSLEESMNEFKLSQSDLNLSEKSKFKPKAVPRQDQQMRNMLRQVENNRLGMNSNFNSKLDQLAVEQVRIEPLAEVELTVGTGNDHDDDNSPNRRPNRPIRPPPRNSLNNNLNGNGFANSDANHRPLYSMPKFFQNQYENLSDYTSENVRSVPLSPSGSHSSGASNIRSMPMSPTGSQGSGSSKVPLNAYSNGSQSNQSSSSRQTSSSTIQPSRSASGPSSNPNPNSQQRGSNNDGNDDRRERRKDLGLAPRNTLTDQDDEQVLYVEEDELAQLDTNNFDVYQNSETGESILVDMARNQEYVVLPRNWRSADDSFYFAEEDIDFNGLNIFVDARRNRKYIVDPRTNRKYFIVFKRCLRKLTVGVRPAPNKAETQLIQDSNKVIRVKHDDEVDDFKVNYVQEDELLGININLLNVYQDEESKEVMLLDPDNPGLLWVVLANDWRTSEVLPYISEEDINLINVDVYQEPNTKRKYLIDEKSGQRYYLIPKFRDNILDFISPNKLLPADTEPPQDLPAKEKRVNFQPTVQTTPPSTATTKPAVQKSFRIGDEEVQILNNEPSTFKLRKTAFNSPERNQNATLPYADQSRLIIKQPGKPGHLIRNTQQPGKPIPSRQTDYNNNNRPNPNRNTSTPPVRATSAGGNSGGDKKPINKTNPNLIKMRQEAARRAFFAQKLPYVGELWLHQLLIEQVNHRKKIGCLKDHYNSVMNLDYEQDPNRYMDENGNLRSFRSLNALNDPTSDAHGLDRNRLDEVQIYGYEKFNKNKRKIFGEEKENFGRDDNVTRMPNNDSFGGDDYPYARGILTEDYVQSKVYVPLQINPYFRALYPYTKLNMRQQFLLTPGYLKHTWQDVVHRKEGLVPRIILINDDEKILTKNRDCNVYVQYYYDNEGVLGAQRPYQLMLPDRGPMSPARPFMISPAKLSRKMELINKTKPNVALREAPVFVYHPNGGAYYENLAQYLAGKQPQLSPATVRKILQFSDLKEFEDYLSAKVTREEAKRLADESGDTLVNLDYIKNQLLAALDPDNQKENPDSVYYHANCEYDPLRPRDKSEKLSEETREFEVDGQLFKSTFIGIGNDGQVKKVRQNELPPNIQRIMYDALEAEKNRKK